jgi:excisionase family DNA binding protein
MESEWLDADTTAASLHITRATLYKLIRQGRLSARKTGGRWWIRASDIEELFVGSGMAVAPERTGRP